MRTELLVGHPQQHGVCPQAEGWLDTGAIACLDAWGLGLNVLFSLAGGADVADGRLSALSDVGVRALRTIALAA
jgi:hypothetical protein